MAWLIRKFTILLILMAMSVPPIYQAQAAEEPLLIWSSGQLEADNSIYYSIFLQSGDQDLSGLTIVSTLPDKAIFSDVFWTPEAATFAGETDGVVTWQLDDLPASTLMGPFTYHVSFDEENLTPPAEVAAKVTWEDGTVEAELTADILTLLEESGTVQITPRGSPEFVAVGKTGIWIQVPAQAISEPTTLTFTRLPISDDTNLPEVAEDTWWCTLVKISMEPAVEFSKPVTLFLPTKRALLPTAVVPVFSQTQGGTWTLISSEDAPTAKAEIDETGGYAYVEMDEILPDQTLAIGINRDVRSAGTTSKGHIDPICPP